MKKTYFKKALSLIMAVVMIMSCWVWIAPQKAEAVVGKYDVTIKFNLEDDDAVGGHVVIWYYPLKADGSGFDTSNTTQKHEVASSLKGAAAKDHEYTQTINGWPWRLELKIDDTDLLDETYLELKYFKIGTKEIVTSSIGDFQNAICYFDYNGTFTPHDENGKSIGANAGRVDSVTGEGFTWGMPEATTITWSNTPEAMTCPKSGSATQTVAVSALDQYGVEMYNPTWSVKGSACGTTGISVSSGTSNAANTNIQLTNAANNTTTTDSQTGTVTATWGSKSNSKTFTITDSYYTATFNYQTQNADLVTSTTTTETRSAYHGDTITAPTAPSYYDGDYLKTFSAWSPAFASTITKDVTYNATYTSTFTEADYTAVNNAIAAADAIKAQFGTDYEFKYTHATRTALDSAINAVIRGLGRTQQTTVDGYAQAINAAIAALEPNKFDVIFLDRFGAIILYDKNAEYKTSITPPAFPEDQKTYFDAENHYTYTGWDSNEYTSVLDDLVIAPVYKAEAHDWKIETVTSTCVQAGTTKYTCKVCGYVKYDGGDQLGNHVWEDDFTVDLEPTCVNPGSKSIHCTLCDARKDETVVPAKGHQWGTVSSLAPATCDRDGIDTRLCDECDICEHVLVPALGHDYVKTTVAPTCTAKGYDEYTCDNCSHSYRDNYTNIIAHSYGAWETVSEAHCGVAGVKKQTCTECGYVNIGSIDALQHDSLDSLAWNVIIAPTCTGTGYQTKTCSKCNNVIASEVTAALTHNYEVKEVVEATCTAGGYTVKECSREGCGAQLITDKTVAKNHAWTSVTHAATCTTSAYIEHTCANDEGHNYVEYVSGSNALTHDFKGTETVNNAATCLADGEKTVECTRCEATTTVIIPKLGHNYSTWVKVDATNDTDGSWTRECANCKDVETVVIPKGGHNLVKDAQNSKTPICNEKGKEVYICDAHENCSVKVEIELDYAQHTVTQRTNEATCTAKGFVEAYCSVCSEIFETTETPVKAHSFDNGTVVAPTCTTSGYTTYKCTGCTFSYNEYDASKPATGHNYKGVETTATSCTAEGLMTYTCENDGCTESYTEEIPATGHSYVLKNSIAADCTTPATEDYECACGEKYTKFISAALGHQWSDTWELVSEATVDRNGVEKRECNNCDVYEYRTTAPIGDHEFTSEITTPATCTQPGVETFTCTKHNDCSANYTKPVPATGHAQEIIYNAPTCIAAGSTKVICNTCGEQILYKEIPVIAHNYGEGVILEGNDATCEAEGYKTFTCTTEGCNAQRTETIPAKGHDLTTTVTDATCGGKGSVVTSCNRCDIPPVTTELAAKGHIWGKTPVDSKAADCENDGYETYKCQNCNETNTVVIAKLGHDWSEWVVTPSKNNAPGSVSRTCLRGCTESVTIPAGNHDLIVDEENSTDSFCAVAGKTVYKCKNHDDCGITLTVDAALKQHNFITDEKGATCTEPGYVKTVCSACGKTVTNEVREKIAHTYVPVAYADPTCTTSGYTTYKCSCGDSYNVYDASKPATGHSLVEGASTATCTGEGLMTITCKNCTEYNTTVKVPALGHDYIEDAAAATSATCAAAATKTFKCSRCTASYTISEGEKTTEHNWDDAKWEVKQSATENSIGYKTNACTVCGQLKVETIDATGEHSFIGGVVKESKPATCIENGYEIRECTVHDDCGKTSTITLPALGHEESLVYTAATCDGAGSTKIVCDVCKAERDEKIIPALGHAYGEGTVTPATCKDKGSIVYECTRTDCGGTHTVEIATNANAHRYATTVTEANCETDGSVVTKCTLCGDITRNTTLAAKGHYFAGEETQTKAPTCTADGTKNVKCKFCDETTVVAVPKLGHSFGEWEKTDATNDADGEWKRECSVCHTTETLIIPKGGHNLVKDTQNSTVPSCSEKGNDVYYCNVHENCTVRVTVELDYTQHDIELVTEEATCTQTGSISVACKNCDKDFGIAAELPVKAHVFGAQTAVPPTCTTSGYTPYKCDCGYTYNVYDDSKPATGHTFDETITANVTTVDATCTADGSKTVKCKECDVKNKVVLPKTGHSYTVSSEKAATCTQAATKTYTCTCGSSYVEFTSEAKGHTYGEWTEIQAPTDVNFGIKKRTCTACSAEEFATVAPIGDHDFVGEVTKAPTCTETGIKTFTCQNHTTCKPYTEVIPALGHKESIVYTAATCDGAGSTKIVCDVCKAERDEKIIPALGHAWNDGTITKATCATDGKIEYSCTRTDCNGTKVTVIPRDYTSHDYETTITQPSCTKEGSIVVKCSRTGCPSKPVDQVLPKKEHTWGTPVITDPKCEEYGSKVYTCTANGCGAEKVEVIEKLGHDWNDWVVTPSTNDTPGSVSRTCKHDANHVETVEIPAGGHNLVEDTSAYIAPKCDSVGQKVYKCTNHANCTITVTVVLDMIQHNFVTTKTDATCTEEGKVVTKCDCGETITTTIPATGHTYDNGVKTDATCEKEGKIVYTCAAAGCNVTREVVLEKKQHNYVAGTPVAATCTSSGYTPYDCATCDSNYVIVTADAKGHTFDEFVKSTATCLTGGKMTLECDCGETMETDVLALGHDYKLDSTTPATCAEGETETYKCSRCTASYTVSVGSKTTDHDWNDWVIVEEPSYTSIGYQTRTCKLCDKLEVETLQKAGDHNLVLVDEKAPDCENDGYKKYECDAHTDCGITDEIILPALGHTEEIDYKAATCTAAGYAKRVCTVEGCNKVLETVEIEKLDHVWGNEEITLSDCKTNGKVEFTCTYNCGATHSIELPLNDKAHTPKTTVEPASCKEAGSSVTVCETCGKELVKTELPKLQHVWGEWKVTTEATNSTEGEMTRTCANGCTETVNFPAGGHAFGNVPDSIDPATCTKEGTATYKCNKHEDCGVEITVTLAKVQHTLKTEKEDATCTKEGFVKVYCTAEGCDYEPVNVTTGKLAHEFEVIDTVEPDCNTSGYKVYKCKNCEETYNEIDADALAHNYVEVEGSSTADCVNGGTKTLKCDKCGKEITVTVPALGHTWGEGVVTTDPTCKDKGVITFTCTVCNDTMTEELPTITHELTTTTTDATCTEDGLVVTVCKYCDYRVEKTIAKKGHTWADTPVADLTVDATCEAPGNETYECVNCDATNVVVIPALGHVYEAGEKIAPTCTTSGYTVYKCKNDESHTYNVYDAAQPAKGHSFGEWTVVRNATETTEGLKERKCACGEKEEEKIPAMMHNMVEVVAEYIAPTCTANGQRVYKCDTKHSGVVCTYTLTVELPMIAHALDTKVTNAKCEVAGSVVTTCTKCETVNIVTPIPAMGHAWDEGKVTTEASCTTAGEITFTCKHDASHTYTKPIEKKQHNFVAGEEVPATCTENAYIPYDCENCEESYVIITGDAKGHEYVIGKSTATCEVAGTITITCDNCEEIIVIAVDALGHDWGAGKVINQPTCLAEGTIEYECSRCGGKKTDKLDKVDHDYTTVTNQASCTEDGSVVSTCKYCGDVITTVIPAKGHTWADTPESTVPAKCEEKGSATYKCENCGETKTTEIPALGHVYEAKETVAPTCKTSGYTVYVCKNDASHTYNVYDASKPAVPHEFSAWTVVENATQDTDGLERRTCVCGEVEEKVIPAMKHNMVVVSTEDATCTAEGKIVYECQTEHDGVVCNYTLTVVTSKIAHSLKTTVTPATCETAGSVVTTCSAEDCTAVNETTVLPALGHKYVGSVTTPAGCETEGEMTYTCQNDAEHTYTEVIPAKGHSYTPKLTAPTCTAAGYTTYTCACGDSYVDDEVPALGHNFGSWKNVGNDEVHQRSCSRCSEVESEAHRWDDGKVIVEPSYDNEGQTLYTCGICGDTKIEGIDADVDDNAPTGKIKWNATLWNDFLSIITFGTYVNYDVVLEITAEDAETGVKSIEYFVSDKALTLDEVKALTNWSAYDSANKLTVPAVDASNVVVYAKLTDNKGNVAYLSTDGIVFDTTAPVLSIKADKGNAQTDVYCSNVTIEIVDANISYAIYDGKTVALTTDKFFCNEVGTHTVTVFDKAGNSTEITFTINDVHTWTEAPLDDESNLKSEATCDDKAVYYAACSVCGELDMNTTFEYGDALGHNYVGTVTTPATCEEDGVMTYICQNDGSHTYTEAISATGHTANEAVQENTVDAKCEKDGSYDMVVYCGVCGKELSRTSHIIPAIGHDYEGTVTKAPTCTEDGVMTYVCKNDSTHAYSEIIDALGHTDENYDCICEVCGEKCCKETDLYIDSTQAVEPSCTKPGRAVLRCDNCRREDITVIPALGHKEVVTYYDATCSEFAYKIITCAKCNALNEKIYTDNVYTPHSVVVIPEKPATCVTDGHTAYERCVTCGKVTESKILYKEDVPHVDKDGNGKCDVCDGQFFTDTKTCNCLCHGTGIKGFLYKIALFFWKIFKMNKSCACGNVHY